VGRAGIYRFFGHAPVIATALKLVRWPLLLAILLAVIAAVYRYGPNARHTWRQCLPGAAPAMRCPDHARAHSGPRSRA